MGQAAKTSELDGKVLLASPENPTPRGKSSSVSHKRDSVLFNQHSDRRVVPFIVSLSVSRRCPGYAVRYGQKLGWIPSTASGMKTKAEHCEDER